jgi:hypothetical protein
LAGDASPNMRVYSGEINGTSAVINGLALSLENGDNFYTGTVVTLYGIP